MQRRIHRSWKARAVGVAVAAVALATPVAGQRRDLQKPLVLASQGSFFVGGETKSLGTIAGRGGPAPAGDVTVNQMVQDRNSLDLADLILQWIDRHAEPYAKGVTRTN